MCKLEQLKKDLNRYYPTIPVVDASVFSSEFEDECMLWIRQEASEVTNVAGDKLFSNTSVNTINKRFKEFINKRGFGIYEEDQGTKFLIAI